MGLKKKLEGIVLSKLTAMALVKAAEGDFGKPIKTLYWFLRGKKAWIGLVLGVVAGGLEYASKSGACDAAGLTQCTDWSAKATGALGVISLYFSQVDGALHTDSPEK